MADLVEKLQLEFDKIFLKFEPIGLRDLCRFTGVQKPEYEGKTKQHLIKISRHKG